MTSQTQIRAEIRERMFAIAGEGAITDRAPVSGQAMPSPWLTVRPADTDQVQRIVALANETLTPLVPVSSAAPHRRGGSAPLVGGVVEVDLRRMNRILRMDRRTRLALIEPGVTFEQLVPALAAEGMRIAMPLIPKPGKSVIASMLEREALVTPRFAWNPMEPLRTLEVVWGSGEKLFTGNGHLRGEKDSDWEEGLIPLVAGGPAQLDFFRLIAGAQGAMGIATWASVKTEPISTESTLLLLTADRLEDLTPCAYELVKLRFGDETFIVNANALAMLIETEPAARAALAASLPRWTLVVGIGGGSILGAQKLAARVADIREIAARHAVSVRDDIPGVTDADLLAKLQAPSDQPYWRDNAATGSEDVFFLTTLDRAMDFVKVAEAVAADTAFAARDLAVYLQPIHQGAGLHCELIFPFNRSVPTAEAAALAVKHKVGRAVFEHGAYFSRPYGEWADWVFSADPATTALTRTVKGIFDPKNVMNPGKLCFPTSVG